MSQENTIIFSDMKRNAEKAAFMLEEITGAFTEVFEPCGCIKTLKTLPDCSAEDEKQLFKWNMEYSRIMQAIRIATDYCNKLYDMASEKLDAEPED